MRKAHLGVSIAVLYLAANTGIAVAQSMPQLSQDEILALARNPAVSAAMVACSDDRWRLCPAVMPGGGRIARCLVESADHLSSACRSAMFEARKSIAAARGADLPQSVK
jgi:hypothetical protein